MSKELTHIAVVYPRLMELLQGMAMNDDPDEVIRVGPFEVISVNGEDLTYWPTGERQLQSVLVMAPKEWSPLAGLSVSSGDTTTTLRITDGLGLEKARAATGENRGLTLLWLDKPINMLPRGSLLYARAAKTRQRFVTYTWDTGYEGVCSCGRQAGEHTDFEAPLKLTDGTDLFGEPVRLWIDFAAESKALYTASQFQTFYEAILTGR
jgi:hypothetical protein